MLDSISLQRLSQVHPVLSAKVQRLAELLAKESIEIRVTQALRNYADQLKLWQKGRDEHGNIVDGSQIVTNAAPGHSWHEFGLAVDVCPFVGRSPDWNLNHPAWKRIVEVGESLELFSGTQFHSICDTPHFQLTGKFPASPNDEVRTLLRNEGIEAVWKASGIAANLAVPLLSPISPYPRTNAIAGQNENTPDQYKRGLC